MAKRIHDIYIGDNKHWLNNLLKSDVKVDCICIDPNYGAKNRAFKPYSDINSGWYNEIFERISLAHTILNDDGVIFVFIGDDKICEMKSILDKVFGKTRKIAMCAIETPNQTASMNFIKNTEYCLIYSKSLGYKLNLPSKEQVGRCTTGRAGQSIHTITLHRGTKVVGVKDGEYPDCLKTGGLEDLTVIGQPIRVKDGKLTRDIKLKGRWSCPNDVLKWAEKMKSNSSKPIYNKYGKEIKEVYLRGLRFAPFMIKQGFENPYTFVKGFASKGKQQLTNIIGPHNFSFVKDVNLIKYFIEFGLTKPNPIVLDFYSGTGTTLHAVEILNSEKGYNAQCILIDNNENSVFEKIAQPRFEALKSGDWYINKREPFDFDYNATKADY